MLRQLIGFCEANGLQPFLVAGSAIGAIRHGDFVPWDDDVDVGLMRDDFERLVRLLEAQPLPGLWLQTYRSDSAYPHSYAKLRKAGTEVHESSFDGTDIHRGIFIDIFPFDLLPMSKKRRRLDRAVLTMLNVFIMSFSWNVASASPVTSHRLIRRIAFVLRPLLPWRHLIRLRERIANPRGQTRSTEAICFEMYGIGNASRTIIDASCLVPPSRAQFGHLSVPVPRDAHRYLTALFGDYMTYPPEGRRRPLHVTWVDC